jgi:hypothetical protein
LRTAALLRANQFYRRKLVPAAVVSTPERAAPLTVLPQEAVVPETIQHSDNKLSAKDGHAAK